MQVPHKMKISKLLRIEARGGAQLNPGTGRGGVKKEPPKLKASRIKTARQPARSTKPFNHSEAELKDSRMWHQYERQSTWGIRALS